jgi:tetratricopeptide (TPR) repeat protein
VTVRRAAVALAAVCLFLAASDAALARSSRRHRHHHKRTPSEKGSGTDGKSHLKRANALAGEGDCKAAIEEYTKAYDLLADPVVLFNRGECYRRTGNADAAIDDYRTFLEAVPSAPNRADIEAKILALEAPDLAARESAPEAKAPPPAKGPPAKGPPPAKQPPPAKPAETTPPKLTETPAVAPPAPAPAPPPALEPKPEPAATLSTPAHTDDTGPGGGTRPWVWIALSALAVGAAVGGYFLFRPQDEPPPPSALGNYRF